MLPNKIPCPPHKNVVGYVADGLESRVHTKDWFSLSLRWLQVLARLDRFLRYTQLLPRRFGNGHAATWRRDLERVGLLLGEEHTHCTHFLLDWSQSSDQWSESQLVLRHQSSDVINVLFLSVVILDVILHVLKSHIQDPQNALDRVQLRQG